VSCVPVYHRFEPSDDTDDPLSWTSIAAAVRNHAVARPLDETQDLLAFADLLDGFAELERRGTD
jgi:hypothetical protein